MELIVHGVNQNMKYGVKSALDSILNVAERSIKPHVIVRKRSFQNRTSPLTSGPSRHQGARRRLSPPSPGRWKTHPLHFNRNRLAWGSGITVRGANLSPTDGLRPRAPVYFL